jgi:hypothetical protein
MSMPPGHLAQLHLGDLDLDTIVFFVAKEVRSSIRLCAMVGGGDGA